MTIRAYPDRERLALIALISLAFIMMAAIFTAALHLPGGVSISPLYSLVILYSWLLPGRYTSLVMAGICSLLIIVDMAALHATGPLSDPSRFNHLVGILVIWLSAALVTIGRCGFSDLMESRRNLEKLVRERTAALNETNQRMQLMLKQVQDYAIIMLDADGTISSWNVGAHRIYRISSSQIIGHPFRSLFSDQPDFDPDDFLTRGASQKHLTWKGELPKRNDEWFWGQLSLSRVQDNQGECRGFLVIVQDLTTAKAYEEAQVKQTRQLEAKNAQLHQFAFVASHDLQEPLRTVTSFVQRLQSHHAAQLDDGGKKCLDFILDATGRMSCLISALLEYSRLGRNLETVLIDMNELVQEVLDDLTSMIENVKAEVDVAPLPKIRGLREELRMLFQNLIQNGLKFRNRDTPPHLIVSSELSEEGCIFRIADNGIGVPEEGRERIFGLFQRLHHRSAYEGTGIGLAHCLRIVQLHGGKIWVEDSEMGGSCFVFLLQYDTKG